MDYLTVSEVANLKGCSERYIRKLIFTNVIQADARQSLAGGGNGGISYQIPLANLEPKLQKKYIRLKAKEQVETEVPEADSKVIPFNLEELSDAEREQVAFWKKLLQDWQTYRQSAKSKTEADSQYLQMLDLRYGLKITARSLERKWKKWQEEGDAALVDNRGKHGKHHRALSKEAYEIFEYYYLDALDLDYEEIKEKVEGQGSLSYALNQTTQESITKTENLNGVQINSLMNIIRMVKEQSITRKEAISIIVNTLGISKETAENFIEDAGEVLEDGAISGTGGTTSVKN